MPDDEEVPVSFDEFDQRFLGRQFGARRRANGMVDGLPIFYRHGTVEEGGIRITLREDLKEAIVAGDGFLGVSRGRCYLIPLSYIRDWLGGKLDQRTVDIRLDVHTGELNGPGVPGTDVRAFRGERASPVPNQATSW